VNKEIQNFPKISYYYSYYTIHYSKLRTKICKYSKSQENIHQMEIKIFNSLPDIWTKLTEKQLKRRVVDVVIEKSPYKI
jgi:hypothetical protein